jgi:hypothetical protein
MMPGQAALIRSGFVVVADFVEDGYNSQHLYGVGNIAGANGLAAELTARGDVVQVAVWFVSPTLAERITFVSGYLFGAEVPR